MCCVPPNHTSQEKNHLDDITAAILPLVQQDLEKEGMHSIVRDHGQILTVSWGMQDAGTQYATAYQRRGWCAACCIPLAATNQKRGYKL